MRLDVADIEQWAAVWPILWLRKRFTFGNRVFWGEFVLFWTVDFADAPAVGVADFAANARQSAVE